MFVNVYEDIETMQEALQREQPHEGDPEYWTKCAAAVTSQYVEDFKDGKSLGKILECQMWLHQAKMGVGLLSHESFHAALNFWGKDHKYKDLGKKEAEEELAWLVGEVTRCVSNGLYDTGCLIAPS